MNGVHDIGGMTTFGPIRREANAPVFHSDFDRRVFALNMLALAYFGPIDRARHAVELMDPVEYLTTTYYEHWLFGLERMAVDLGYVTASELASGKTEMRRELPHPAPDAEMIAGFVSHGLPATRDDGRQTPRFAPGDAVRARNIEVKGHTRLARYVRGRTGRIHTHNGTHAFPDTAAHDRGENPQPLYTVRFEARELWGDNVERRDCVYIDLWEDYLEPAGS